MTWLTLEEMRQVIQEKSPNKWRYGYVFESINVAVEIGADLHEFWEWPEGKRAYYIARSRANATIAEFQRLQDRPRGSGKGKSLEEFW